jgi:hypothetical protein
MMKKESTYGWVRYRSDSLKEIIHKRKIQGLYGGKGPDVVSAAMDDEAKKIEISAIVGN